jgi:hypothetical protein
MPESSDRLRREIERCLDRISIAAEAILAYGLALRQGRLSIQQGPHATPKLEPLRLKRSSRVEGVSGPISKPPPVRESDTSGIGSHHVRE